MAVRISMITLRQNGEKIVAGYYYIAKISNYKCVVAPCSASAFQLYSKYGMRIYAPTYFI